MQKILTIFVFSIMLPSFIFSQVNTEKFRNSSTTKALSGKASINMLSRSGNVQTTQVLVDAGLALKFANTHSFAIYQGDQGWQGGKQFSSEALLHVGFVYNVDRFFQPEAYAQIDYNKARKLEDRKLLGAGFRLKFLNDETWGLWYGSSYQMEREKLILTVPNSHPSSTNVRRWSNYITFGYEKEKRFKVAWTTYVQPDFAAFSDYRVLSDLNFSVLFTKVFALTTNVTMRYDSSPPDNVEELDTTIISGISFAF